MSRAGSCLVVLLLVPIGLASQQAPQIQTTFTLQDGTPVQGTIGGVTGGLVGRGAAPLKTGTSLISGRVLTNNGQPLRQATVNVTAPELNGARTTDTDQDGRYEVKDLPAGRYSVSARKTNYIGLSYGQTRPNEIARPVQLADNQRADRIDLTLPRGGVIAGRVLDEYGEPVTDAQVIPMQRRMSQGQLRLMGSGRTASTNDIGEFRLFGLPPGQYFVSSTLRAVVGPAAENTATRFGYAPTYYPGTPVAAHAQPIAVGLSETINGIDLSLTATRLATISGSTADSQGVALTRGNVSATDRNGNTTSSTSATIRPDGTFLLPPLPPGEYLLRTSVPPPPPPTPGQPRPVIGNQAVPPEVLMATVSVNGSDVSGVLLTPMKRITISGRVTFDPAAGAALRNSMVRLSLSPRSPEAAMGMVSPLSNIVKDDFTFQFVAPAAEVLIRAAVANPEWVVKAIRVSGFDITDTGVDLRGARDVDGLEIELTNRPPEVSGMVVAAKGEPQSSAILLFPQDRERWIFDSRLIAMARSDQSGRYRIRTLPPGRYLAVVTDLSQVGTAMQDPDVLESLRSRATPFSIGEGEKKTLDLKVAFPQ